jgi:general stress protein 26
MSGDILNRALKLVEKNSHVMVGSIDDDGYPNMKMMFNARVRDGIKVFYFTTNTSSLRTSQFVNNPRASLYFSNNRFFNGLMLKGQMEVLKDKKSREMIWREGDEMYYPLGVTDPDYCVLKFTGETGRYYANFKSTNFSIE